MAMYEDVIKDTGKKDVYKRKARHNKNVNDYMDDYENEMHERFTDEEFDWQDDNHSVIEEQYYMDWLKQQEENNDNK